MKNKIDVLINACILAEKNTGLGVYTYQLLEHLIPELEKRNLSYEIMCSDINFLPKNCRRNVVVVSFKGFVSRLLKSSYKYKRKYRLVWSTTHHGGLFSKTKQVITIHDLTPVFYPDGRKHQTLYYNWILPQIIKRCEFIFSVSESTKRDVMRKYATGNEKVKTVYEGLNSVCKVNDSLIEKEVLSRYQLEDKKYFVITGIHYKYKNIQLVIEAYKKYPVLRKYKTVIIGNDNCEYGEYLKKLICERGLLECFVFSGFVDNQSKIVLVQHSDLCIFPSLYEGFGIPILEAMYLGVPVITSDVSSLPEVGGDAAIYFNPKSVESLYEKISCILNDANIRNNCIQRGYINVLRFDWDLITKNMVDNAQVIIEAD